MDIQLWPAVTNYGRKESLVHTVCACHTFLCFPQTCRECDDDTLTAGPIPYAACLRPWMIFILSQLLFMIPHMTQCVCVILSSKCTSNWFAKLTTFCFPLFSNCAAVSLSPAVAWNCCYLNSCCQCSEYLRVVKRVCLWVCMYGYT